ncbi:TPA: hypothetical protein ACIC9P_003453 [Morganella morganii]|uniref:ECs1072 family phage-associated protein n=1 Tax=Morganella morganii TaxID=582 RepID=UPI00190C8D3B|nr:hypothetical protein [Morganella morganii]QQO71359.1 hypothetical protein IDH72_12505 [Morganella morganii]
MSYISDLWSNINEQVCCARKITRSPLPYGFIKNMSADDVKVFLRSLQIFILEDILRQHREQYATITDALYGEKSLNHKLFIKTNIPINLIKNMTLSDKVLMLQDEIKIENLSRTASDFINKLAAPEFSITFDDFLPDEWDIERNRLYLVPLAFDYPQ